MRNVPRVETPSLFTPELLVETESLGTLEPREGTADALARDFVHWCWGVGGDFHNSPDITNLRFWLGRGKAIPSASEEAEILAEARRLFLKKVEQAVRKADVSKDKD
jgi:hypothetical protein